MDIRIILIKEPSNISREFSDPVDAINYLLNFIPHEMEEGKEYEIGTEAVPTEVDISYKPEHVKKHWYNKFI